MTTAVPWWKRVPNMAGEGLLNILYPPQCMGCGTRLAVPKPVCERCVQRLERVAPEAVSERLARLAPTQQHLDGGFALWHFDKGGTLQRVQHALKYGNRPQFGVFFGGLMGEALKTAGRGSDGVVVPIPLHRTRFLERGYNQSALLAEGVATVLQQPVHAQGLVRARVTRSQTKLSREARWQNVLGAFVVDTPEALAGQSVLLIDDVLTTGATAAAAAHALKAAGARTVTLATLALARF